MISGAIDRAAHHRADPVWLEQAWARSRVCLVQDSHVSEFGEDHDLPGDRIFLGVDDAATPYFAVLAPTPGSITLREVLYERSPTEIRLYKAAVALANWHERHRFHPETGEPTVVTAGGWMRRTADGKLMWPRTDPAILAFISDGVAGERGRCLLAGNVARPANSRSCIAGFVEPGESLEDTVAREASEELGISVWDIRYVGSEAWPFGHELMFGFTARADPEQPLTLQADEIAAAGWFSRAELRGPDAPDLPGKVSISRRMIDDWLEE